MSPAEFERLAQRLWRKSGFSSGAVTGRTGDGGIDGCTLHRSDRWRSPLCDLLKENGIGVTTTERVVEDVKIGAEYFKSLEPKD
ncbi:restriction endonuclease [Mycobacteroides chelonae]|uniref:restriction endonuclease n=1 Tax=Mycobacteroides chelonae TaxID=1774 RepID=UPI001E3A177C|nr:restriction endonuclease [Mycobacteroides chelonae]MEC4838971.1 restriction endonuclease [Mycobacteroides chelonae]MEC4844919.1 restriction endonuclease [Mycobacteroides chelonae]WED94153.1 restriction endonuclease [Mycobacteroides chelonae]WED98024.1 restriction endonuclease [Mycobacteroides chelonae]